VSKGMRRDYYWSVTPKGGDAALYEKGLASQLWGFQIDSMRPSRY
jgi:hypothetical protein